MSLPSSLTAIKDIESEGVVNLLGYLIEHKEPYRSQGGDYVLDFTIQDDFNDTSIGQKSKIRCRVFRRDLPSVPSVGSIGDIILIKNIKVTEFNGRFDAVSSRIQPSAVMSFPISKVPAPEFSDSYGTDGGSRLVQISSNEQKLPTAQDQLAIIHLKARAGPLGNRTEHYTPTKPTIANRAGKRALIKDLELGTFKDLVVEVVKSFSAQQDSLDLYVTDYTANESLFLYVDPDLADEYGPPPSLKWQGPYGQVTMAIRLWEPHASYAREHIREGDVVFLKNVKTKLSEVNKLEGALHGDQRYPHRIQIHKITYRPQLEEHRARRQQYLEKYQAEKSKAINLTDISLPKKPSAKTSAKKKEERKEKERLRKQQEQMDLERVAQDKEIEQSGVNPHVVASHPDIRLSSIEDILNNPARAAHLPDGQEIALPFVNCKHRARLRVVDYAPRNISNFIRSTNNLEMEPAVSLEDLAPYASPPREEWEWGFILLVEAADAAKGKPSTRFPLFVTDESGRFLLNMDARALKDDTNGQALKQLEEKLFILWGNLSELKNDLVPKGVEFPLPVGDDRLQNMPFDCCIDEYGSRVPKSAKWPLGWQRNYKIAMTVIRD